MLVVISFWVMEMIGVVGMHEIVGGEMCSERKGKVSR
jgi:hypothetical protein